MACVNESTTIDFSNNGLGAVSPRPCSVPETLNGKWERTLVHLIDENGKWLRMIEERILHAPVPAAMIPQIDIAIPATTATWIYKINTSSGNLYLRFGTGTGYKIPGKYTKGTQVIVVAKTTSGWYKVSCPDGKHGYKSASYLQYVKAASTPQEAKHEVMEARQLRDQPFRIWYCQAFCAK